MMERWNKGVTALRVQEEREGEEKTERIQALRKRGEDGF